MSRKRRDPVLCSVCKVVASDDEPFDRFDRCRQCRAAYDMGRRHAIDEAIAMALRVRGPVQSSRRKTEIGDEHADGSYSAACAIVATLRRMRRWQIPRSKRRRRDA